MELNLNDPRAQHAIAALCITLPIYRADVADDGVITFYLYGGQRPTWSPPKPKPALRSEPTRAIAQPSAEPPTQATPPAPKRRTKKEVLEDEPIR